MYDYLMEQARSARPGTPTRIYFRHSTGEAEGGYSVLGCAPGRGLGDEYFSLAISNWPRTPILDAKEPIHWGIGDYGLREVILPLLTQLGAQIVPDSEVGLWKSVFSGEPRSSELISALDRRESFDVGITEEVTEVIRFLLSREEFKKNRKKKLTPLEQSNLLVRDPKFMAESLENLLKLIESNHRVFELGLSVLREQGFYPTIRSFNGKNSGSSSRGR